MNAPICYYVLILSLGSLVSPKLKEGANDGKLKESTCNDAVHNDVSKYEFEQKLDHSDDTNVSTWKQRYFVIKKNFKPRGPVLLIIGGKNEIQTRDMTTGVWIKYAEELNALCIFLELRYYGCSYPTEDLSTENLQKYLNTRQVLGDLKRFIWLMAHHSTHDIQYETKWVTFGGSYAGSLAVWLNLKTPHNVEASVTSGAQIIFKVNYGEYNEDIERLLKEDYPSIPDQIREAYEEIKYFFKNKNTKIIEKTFNICDPGIDIENKNNLNYFYWTIAEILRIIVLYDGTKFKALKKKVFESYTNENNSHLTSMEKHAEAIKQVLSDFNVKCLNVNYNELIKMYNDTTRRTDQFIPFPLSYGLGNRQSYFQSCTEYGTFQPSDKESYMFGNTFKIDFYLDICSAIFGNEYNENLVTKGVDHLNKYFLGPHITSSVFHVIFVNGTKDPMIKLSKTNSDVENNVALNISGASHSTDILSESEGSDVEKAKNEILKKLKEWLFLA